MRKILFLCVAAAVVLFGCSLSDSGDFMKYSGTAKEEAYEYASAAEYSDVDDAAMYEEYDKGGYEGEAYVEEEMKIPEKIIKTASITIETENYESSVVRIKAAIQKWEGQISSENETNYSYRSGNIIEIRVLSKNFENLVNEITVGEEKVVSKTINAQDVTEEYVDIVARLKTKKEVEKRYVEILAQARTINEILSVEERIRQVREEIDAKEGRLKYLNDRVSFSTITVNLYQDFDDKFESGFGEKSGDAFEGGWEGLKLFVVGILYLWPLWLLGIIATVVLLYLLKRRKRKKLGS